MVIVVNKFGTILNGRPSGREAALVLRQQLASLKDNEELVLDFQGVLVLTPSYADEFLQPVRERPTLNVRLENITSPVIRDSLTAIDFPYASQDGFTPSSG